MDGVILDLDLRVDEVIRVIGPAHDFAVGDAHPPGNVFDFQAVVAKQPDGQRLELGAVGDREHLQKRRNRPNSSILFEGQVRPRRDGLDLAGTLVDDQRPFRNDPAVAERLIGIEIDRVIVHRLIGRTESSDRERRQNSQTLDRQCSALSFTPAPRGCLRSSPRPGCRDATESSRNPRRRTP